MGMAFSVAHSNLDSCSQAPIPVVAGAFLLDQIFAAECSILTGHRLAATVRALHARRGKYADVPFVSESVYLQVDASL